MFACFFFGFIFFFLTLKNMISNCNYSIDCDFGVQIDKLVDISTKTDLKIIVSIRNPNGKVSDYFSNSFP